MAKWTKAEIEKHYFEQFANNYTLPNGKIEYGDKPDVRILGEKTIGIEITNLYRQPGTCEESEQRQRPLREGLVSDAQRFYREAGGQNKELIVCFNLEHPINASRQERLRLSRSLASFAREVDSQPSGEVYRHLYQEVMPEFSFIYLNSTEYSDPVWRIAQVHTVEPISKEELEKTVRAKEEKCNQYANCDAYWLLVIVDWKDRAQEQEIMVDNLRISSDVFEKIIVYKPNFNHLVEVKG